MPRVKAGQGGVEAQKHMAVVGREKKSERCELSPKQKCPRVFVGEKCEGTREGI